MKYQSMVNCAKIVILFEYLGTFLGGIVLEAVNIDMNEGLTLKTIVPILCVISSIVKLPFLWKGAMPHLFWKDSFQSKAIRKLGSLVNGYLHRIHSGETFEEYKHLQ